MSEIGHLDAAGILYEGNWAEWQPRLMSLLKYNGLGDCMWYCAGLRDADDDKALQIVEGLTSKHLLARTTKRQEIWLPELLEILERMAQPFRFLDLSAELRNAVYRIALPERVRPLDPAYCAQSATPSVSISI